MKKTWKEWYHGMSEEQKKAHITTKSESNQKRFKTNPAALEAKRKYDKSDKGVYARYKGDCKRRGRLKRGIQMELSLEQFSEIINKPCVFCGDVSRGVDRIDSEKNYTIQNTQSCCSSCNEMKNDKSDQEFINHIKKILTNRGL